ncbi:hypothetical protein BGW37DRAFT_179778 [Umbelopsis sp. PMI_123]|nr:hypothetical protein BGW37DRAFT_179778 [Umbelopsis sp. PMI_123]
MPSSSYREDDSDDPSYSSWRYRLIPTVRVLVLLLATIFVLLSVWLETSGRYESPSSFASNIAMYTVKINSHMNLSDSYTAVPDTVSFGLWRHCFGYIDTFRCLDQNLLYALDANRTLFDAIGNSTTKLTDGATSTSYAGAVIALVTSVVIGCTFCFSLWASSQISEIYIYICAGFNLISLGLVTLLFGWTFHNYSSQVSRACYNIGSDNCLGYSMRLEIIFMIVALVCAAISLFIWACIPAYDIKRKRQQMELIPARNDALNMKKEKTDKKESSDTTTRNSVHNEEIYEIDYGDEWLIEDKSKPSNIHDSGSTHTAATDEPFFKYFRNNPRGLASSQRKPKPQAPAINTNVSTRRSNIQEVTDQKPSPEYELQQLRQNHRRYSELRSSFQPIIERATTTGLRPPPTTAQPKQNVAANVLNDDDDDDDDILAPPELPFARERRRMSQGSGNTFGQVLDSAGDTSPRYDKRDSRFSYDYNSSGQSSPGYSPSRDRRDSSGSYSFGRSHTVTPPIEERGFSMTPQPHTPAPGYHPLNNKAITDNRINAYLGGQ